MVKKQDHGPAKNRRYELVCSRLEEQDLFFRAFVKEAPEALMDLRKSVLPQYRRALMWQRRVRQIALDLYVLRNTGFENDPPGCKGIDELNASSFFYRAPYAQESDLSCLAAYCFGGRATDYGSAESHTSRTKSLLNQHLYKVFRALRRLVRATTSPSAIKCHASDIDIFRGAKRWAKKLAERRRPRKKLYRYVTYNSLPHSSDFYGEVWRDAWDWAERWNLTRGMDLGLLKRPDKMGAILDYYFFYSHFQ